jgi:hypothetical protein
MALTTRRNPLPTGPIDRTATPHEVTISRGAGSHKMSFFSFAASGSAIQDTHLRKETSRPFVGCFGTRVAEAFQEVSAIQGPERVCAIPTALP